MFGSDGRAIRVVLLLSHANLSEIGLLLLRMLRCTRRSRILIVVVDVSVVILNFILVAVVLVAAGWSRSVGFGVFLGSSFLFAAGGGIGRFGTSRRPTILFVVELVFQRIGY